MIANNEFLNTIEKTEAAFSRLINVSALLTEFNPVVDSGDEITDVAIVEQ